MESKNLRLVIIIIVLILSNSSFAQKKDKVRGTFDASIHIIPVFLSGPMDVGNKNGIFIGSNSVTAEPQYRNIDTTGLLLGPSIHLGINIPVFRTDNWSIGMKLSAGISSFGNMKAAEGLKGYGFSFPQFLYFRNYKRNFDYSFLIGYKYTRIGLPFHLLLLGVDFNLGENTALRVYGSPLRYNYYRLLTNGHMEKAIGFMEFGTGINVTF